MEKKPLRERESGGIRSKYREVPQWTIGSPSGPLEKLTALVILAIIAAAFFLEPGYNRPLRNVCVFIASLGGLQAAYLLATTYFNWRTSLTYVVLAIWWIWAVLAGLTSLDSYRTQLSLASWTAGVSVFLLVSLGFQNGKFWRLLVSALVGLCGLLCFAAVVGRAPMQALMGTFTNRDTFSVIPMTASFLALVLARGESRFGRLATLGAWSFFVLFTLATGSRAGVVGVFVGAAAALGCLSLGKNKMLAYRTTQAAGGALAAVLVIGLLTGVVQPLLERFGEAVNGEDIQGMTMRHDVLVQGLETSRHYPILGSGPGTFALAYQEYRPKGAVPDYIFVNYAHDDYIELLVETGWPGFFLWLLFTGLIFLRGIRLIRYSIAPWEASALLGAQISLASFSALNFIVPVPAVFLWQMLILGLIQGLPSGPTVQKSIPPAQKGIALAVALVCLGVAYRGYSTLRADRLVAYAAKLEQSLRWEDSLEALNRALAFQKNHLGALLQRGRISGRLGQFQGGKDKLKEADTDFGAAAKISPRDQEVARVRIAFYRATKQFSKAEELLDKFHQYAAYRESYLPDLMQVRLLQGKLEGAARALYGYASDDQKAQETLPMLLLELDQRQSEAGVNLVREWSAKEGDANISFRFAQGAARLAIAQKNSATAERFLKFLQEKHPKDTETLYLLSEVDRLRGDKEKRIKRLEELAVRSKEQGDDQFIDAALVDLAQLQPMGLMSPAVLRLEQRLKLSPKSVAIRIALSDFYLRNHKIEQANEVISGGLDVNPDSGSLQARMGTCLARQGLKDQARGYFEQALKLSPRNREAKAGLAGLLTPN